MKPFHLALALLLCVTAAGPAAAQDPGAKETIEIEDGNEGVFITIHEAGTSTSTILTPAEVKEVQFALNRARETTEKSIQERGRR